MIDMPETIWAWEHSAPKQDDFVRGGWNNEADPVDTHYRRADLPPTPEQIRALVERVELEWVTPSPTTDGQWQDTTGMYDIEDGILFIGHVNQGIRCESDEAAKAAALADHHTRLLSALGVER